MSVKYYRPKPSWFFIFIIGNATATILLYFSAMSTRNIAPPFQNKLFSCDELFEFFTDLSKRVVSDSPIMDKSQPLYKKEDSAGWQKIPSKTETLYVYSAFYDNYNDSQPVIRLVGMRLLNRKSPMPTTYCTVRNDTGGTAQATASTESVEASFSDIPEHHWRQYTAVFILCPLPTLDIRPRTVNLSMSKTGKALASLRVIYPDHKPRRNFTVCYPPLHKFWDPQRLVEALELSRLLGAEHVVVYRRSVTPAVDAILKHYVTQGFLQLLPWGLPAIQVHYHAQMAAINDCLYRYMGNARYVVMCDFDEVIMPSNGRNWSQLVSDLHLQESNYGAAMFRSVFFDVDQGYPSTRLQRLQAELLGLRSLLITGRVPEPLPWRKRAKSMLVTDRVETAGIHFPFTFRPGASGILKVEPSQAMVNHYRTNYDDRQIDTNLLNLTENLLSGVQDRWRQICLDYERTLQLK